MPSTAAPGGDNADENYEVFWKDLVSGEVRQLTRSTGGDGFCTAAGANLWPRTSADGLRTVFVSNRGYGGPQVSSNRFGLFLCTNGPVEQVLTNGHIVRLLPNVELAVQREFPPFGMDAAGSRVVFASDADLTGENTNRNPEIFSLDLDSRTITQITQTAPGVTNSRPVLSGDGLKVAFVSNGDFANRNGDASEELWVYHFDLDAKYRNTFVQVTSLSTNQPAAESRISWADWYSLNYDGARLVFCSNADPLGQNSAHAYEIFLATMAWRPFKCALSRTGPNQVRLDWPAVGSGCYVVECCTSLMGQAWVPASPTAQWPVSATSWTCDVNPAEPAKFFRVRLCSEWRPFAFSVSPISANQVRFDWPAVGSGLYTVEACTALSNPVWSAVAPTNQWPTSATSWTNTLIPAEPARFFRVKAN